MESSPEYSWIRWDSSKPSPSRFSPDQQNRLRKIIHPLFAWNRRRPRDIPVWLKYGNLVKAIAKAFKAFVRTASPTPPTLPLL